ncbi:MAG: hypothetical protein EBV10_12435 [Synechococcaceae bacterium WB6_1A_059]|nr:hypothetical protein [Synechococcaceae bacterium WB6_1A_059]
MASTQQVDNPLSFLLLYEHDTHTQEQHMGYRVLGKTADLFQGYEQRRGLEGPYIYSNGRILYYDPAPPRLIALE